MRGILSVLALSFCVVLVGCGKGTSFERHVRRADAAYEKKDLEKARIEYLNAVRINPNDAHVLSRIGNIYYQQGDGTSAAQFLAAARTIKPEDIESRSKLALILSSVGNCSNALEEIEFVLAKSPAQGDALIALSGCAITTNEVATTLSRLQALLPAHDTNAQLHLALGFLHQKRQEIEEAEKEYLRAQTLDPKNSKPPFALAGIYWMRGDTNNAEAAFKTAADLAPVKSAERLRLADFKMRAGNTAEGRQILEEAVAKEPGFLAAINVLAELALNEKRTNDCSNLIGKALKIVPNDRTARLLKSRLKLTNGDPDGAVTELEGVTRDFPQDAFAFYQLAVAQSAKRETTRATVSLDRAIVLRPNYPEALLLRSELQVTSGNSAAAIPTLVTLTTRYPGVQRAYVLLAEAYRLRGTPADALRTYQEMAKAFPNDARPFHMAGVLLRQQNKVEEASKAYEAALKLEPDFLPAIDEIIELDISQKKFPEALARIESYIQKYPDKPMPLLLQAKVLNAQDRPAETEAALQKAIQLDPEFILAHRFLVQFYITSKKHNEAIAKLEGMLRKNEKDSVSLLQLSLLYEAVNEFQKARANYEKLVALKPNSALALNNLAYLLSEQFGELDKAAALAQRARDIAPQDPSAADTFGWILYRRGDYARALAVLQLSAEKLTGNPEVAYHLGMAHYSNGNEAEARQALTMATKSVEKPYKGIESAQKALAILNINSATATPKDMEMLNAAIAASKNDLFAQIRLGQVLESQGKHAEAKERYLAALSINPNSVAALNLLASFEIERLNNPAKGMEYARRAWTLLQTPSNAALLGRLGFLAGQFKWSVPLFEQAYQAQRDDPAASLFLALALYTQADLDRPLNLLQPLAGSAKAASYAPQIGAMLALLRFHSDPSTLPAVRTALPVLEASRNTKAPAQLVTAMMAEDPKNPQAALEKYQALVAAEPDFLLAQKQYAVFAEKSQNDAVASPLITRLRQTMPNDPSLQRSAGRIAYRQKDYREASKVLRSASRAYAADADLLYHLGLAQFHANEKGAKETLTRALALDAGSPMAAEARGAISKVQ